MNATVDFPYIPPLCVQTLHNLCLKRQSLLDSRDGGMGLERGEEVWGRRGEKSLSMEPLTRCWPCHRVTSEKDSHYFDFFNILPEQWLIWPGLLDSQLPSDF